MHQVEESTRGRWQLDRVCTEAAGDASQACIRCWRVGLPPCSHLTTNAKADVLVLIPPSSLSSGRALPLDRQ